MQQTVTQPHVELPHRSHEQVENRVTQLLQTGFVLFTQFRNGLPLLLLCASPPAEACEQQARKRPAPAMGHPVQISETSSIAVYLAIGEHTHCHPQLRVLDIVSAGHPRL